MQVREPCANCGSFTRPSWTRPAREGVWRPITNPALGDRSRTVSQSDVPSHDNPGQASGGRVHFLGFQANGHCKRFQSGFNLAKKASLVNLPTHTTWWENNLWLSQYRKTSDDFRVGSEAESTAHPSQKGPRCKPTCRHNVLLRVFSQIHVKSVSAQHYLSSCRNCTDARGNRVHQPQRRTKLCRIR